MCCRQIHKHRNTKAKVHLNTRERVGESLTSSTLSNFSKYLCLSKIPKKTFSWQSILAMIPTAISLTLQELIIKQDIEIVYKLRATLIDASMPLSNYMMRQYLQLHIKTFNKMCPRCLVHDLEEIHSNLCCFTCGWDCWRAPQRYPVPQTPGRRHWHPLQQKYPKGCGKNE